MAMLTPFLAQARLVARSPSGCAIACTPAGETERGKEIFRPNAVVDVSTLETSTRTRGRRRYFEKAVEFSCIVTCSVEPEL